MITTEIKIKGSSRLLEAYFNALEPEQNFKTDRGSYTLKKIKDYLKISIQAKDVVALRAITNTITGLLSIVYKTHESR